MKRKEKKKTCTKSSRHALSPCHHHQKLVLTVMSRATTFVSSPVLSITPQLVLVIVAATLGGVDVSI